MAQSAMASPQRFTVKNEPMITVKINSEIEQIPKETTLSKLIVLKNIATRGIAIAVNQKVISRSKWEIFQLQENDTILIIKATQGG
ncbi:sulfur carrier protein ThiS [Ornithobacterium rhinotracheale]